MLQSWCVAEHQTKVCFFKLVCLSLLQRTFSYNTKPKMRTDHSHKVVRTLCPPPRHHMCAIFKYVSTRAVAIVFLYARIAVRTFERKTRTCKMLLNFKRHDTLRSKSSYGIYYSPCADIWIGTVPCTEGGYLHVGGDEICESVPISRAWPQKIVSIGKLLAGTWRLHVAISVFAIFVVFNKTIL